MIKHLPSLHRRCRRLIADLCRDTSGLAFIEFAYSLPFMMILGLGGIEVANYSITHMRVSQLAITLADNASRAKQEIVSGVPRMREYDVNEAFQASALQSGSMDIVANGTLILSSLETNSAGGQWIHWQRCFGNGGFSSSYGKQGDGISGTSFPGMGPEGRRVTAESGFAVMFAEVVYTYDPLIFDRLISDKPVRKFAAMYVRDDRDLTHLFNPSPAAPVRSCPA